jgi:hypothetical protein
MSIAEVMRLADEYAKAYQLKNSPNTASLTWFFTDPDAKREELLKAVEALANKGEK